MAEQARERREGAAIYARYKKRIPKQEGYSPSKFVDEIDQDEYLVYSVTGKLRSECHLSYSEIALISCMGSAQSAAKAEHEKIEAARAKSNARYKR